MRISRLLSALHNENRHAISISNHMKSNPLSEQTNTNGVSVKWGYDKSMFQGIKPSLYLKAYSFHCELLEVFHGHENFLVSSWHQAQCTKNLKS